MTSTDVRPRARAPSPGSRSHSRHALRLSVRLPGPYPLDILVGIEPRPPCARAPRLCHSLALSLALCASLVHQDDVKCPIAVIWGTKDGLTPSQGPVGRGLRARADAWVDIEGAGHVFFDERPDETIRALTEWVARF